MARPPRNPHIPARHGVSASTVALPAGPWPTVLDFLAERLPKVSRAEWQARLARGEVVDDANRPIAVDAPYPVARPGLKLHYWRALADEPPIPFEATVVFEDERLLVVDKPHFLPVTPTGRFVQETLLVRLKRSTGINTLSPAHRLDRETAGLILFTKHTADRGAYQALFRDRRVHKSYLAIAPAPQVAGWSDADFPMLRQTRLVEDPHRFYRVIEADGEPNSHTTIEHLRTEGDRALYRLTPTTGQRHQLRVHLNAIGLPIEGDQFYPRVTRAPGEVEDYQAPLQLLAERLAFTDPITGAERVLQSDLHLSLSPAG